jgi:hypothetical protein
MKGSLEFIGNVGLFALRAVRRVFVPPFELQMILQQIEVAGWGTSYTATSESCRFGISHPSAPNETLGMGSQLCFLKHAENKRDAGN